MDICLWIHHGLAAGGAMKKNNLGPAKLTESELQVIFTGNWKAGQTTVP